MAQFTEAQLSSGTTAIGYRSPGPAKTPLPWMAPLSRTPTNHGAAEPKQAALATYVLLLSNVVNKYPSY